MRPPADFNRPIEGQEFDTPLILPASGNVEPQRYIAEEPYDLTKYEFEVLRKTKSAQLLLASVIGATVAFGLVLAGKFVVATMMGTTPDWDKSEWAAFWVGVAVSVGVRFLVKTRSDLKRDELESVIDGHFGTKKRRRVHIAGADQ